MNEFDENERYVTIKSPIEIEKMRAAAKLAAQCLQATLLEVRPGVTTGLLDRFAAFYIRKYDAVASSLGYKGFPRSICTSVNDVVCHGIPDDKEVLKDGDIINIDIAVMLDGYHGDNSVTVAVGNASPEAEKLMSYTQNALIRAIDHVKPGIRTRELGAIIEEVAREGGFSTVHEFVGHGIGRGYHEPPMILHYKNNEAAMRLRPGMTFTIEPMFCVGKNDVVLGSDGWTVRTVDKSLSAQFEHTILVTEEGFEVLTLP